MTQKGITMLLAFEGLKLHAYPDPATGGEPWTIGVGTTVYPNGKKVKQGDVITQAQAMQYLKANIENVYEKHIIDNLAVELMACQLDALDSLCYNIGWGNLSTSTVWKLVNKNPNDPKIRDAFMMWNKANGKVMAGLTTRRKKEADCYFGLV